MCEQHLRWKVVRRERQSWCDDIRSYIAVLQKAGDRILDLQMPLERHIAQVVHRTCPSRNEFVPVETFRAQRGLSRLHVADVIVGRRPYDIELGQSIQGESLFEFGSVACVSRSLWAHP